jgi:DNA-binding NtrC family response regulator
MFIATLEVEHDIEHARQSDVNVLITGGDAWTRRAVAERIHRGSRRGTRPFVVLDHANPLVAGLQPLPLESRGRPAHNRWESAGGGTLFIEEIGDLSTSQQAGLWHALNQDDITAAVRPEQVARLLTASTYRLFDRTVTRQFRPDLFYRLNLIHILIPAQDEVSPPGRLHTTDWDGQTRPVWLLTS